MSCPRTLVTAAAATMLCLGGCGGASPATDSTDGTSGTSTARGMGDEELVTMLPREGQMPGDWGVYDGEGQIDEEQSAFPKVCNDLLLAGRAGDDLATTEVGSARRTFVPSSPGSSTGVKITSYSQEVPEQVFTAMADAVDQCSEYQQTDAKGTTTYEVGNAAGPSYGDRSFRFRSTEKETGTTFERVVFSVDNHLVEVLEMHPDEETVRTGGLEAAARAVEENLQGGSG